MTGTGVTEVEGRAEAPSASLRFATAFDLVARSRAFSAIAILVVGLIAFLPGLATIQPVDREEPRFAIASQHLIQGGDLLAIETDLGPIGPVALGAHWLQALSAAILGPEFHDRIVAYRLPSLVLSLGAALLLWWGARGFGHPGSALLAALLLEAALIAGLVARAATDDALLLFLAILAQASLARVWASGSTAFQPVLALLFWLTLGASLVAAGLLLPLAVAATVLILALDRRGFLWLRPLAPSLGLPLLIVGVVAWATLLWLLHGWGAVAVSLFGESQRYAPGSLPNALPPGSHFLFGLVSTFPILIVVALAASWLLDHLRRPAIIFGLATALPVWLAAELAADKGPTQILMALPALALLASAAAGEGGLRATGRWRSVLATSFLTIPVALLIISWAGFFMVEGRLPWSALPAQALAIAAGALAFGLWLRHERGELVAGAAATASLLTGVAMFGFIAPDFDALRVSERAIAAVREAASCPNPHIIGGSYREPSLVFLAGPLGRSAGAAEAADFLAATPCGVAVIDGPATEAFIGRALDIGLGVTEAGRVAGVSAGNARPVELVIYVRSDQGTAQPALDP